MKRLTTIALIPWTIVSTIINSILDSAKSGSASVSITLDLGVVLIVLAVLVLVYIFKYGAVLQQESDETLWKWGRVWERLYYV